jgi:hypothetical protein
MFKRGATSFNQDISIWDVSSAIIYQDVSRMLSTVTYLTGKLALPRLFDNMFNGAASFQPTSVLGFILC